jgi:hypothetical protein
VSNAVTAVVVASVCIEFTCGSNAFRVSIIKDDARAVEAAAA